MDVDGSEVEVGVGVEVEVGVASDNGVDDVKREKNEVKKRMRWGVFRRAAIIYRQPVSPDLRSISNPNSLKLKLQLIQTRPSHSPFGCGLTTAIIVITKH